MASWLIVVISIIVSLIVGISCGILYEHKTDNDGTFVGFLGIVVCLIAFISIGYGTSSAEYDERILWSEAKNLAVVEGDCYSITSNNHGTYCVLYIRENDGSIHTDRYSISQIEFQTDVDYKQDSFLEIRKLRRTNKIGVYTDVTEYIVHVTES